MTASAKTTCVRHITKLQLLNRLSRYAIELNKKGYNVEINLWSHYQTEARNEMGILVTKRSGEEYDVCKYEYFHLPIFNVEVEAKLASLTEKLNKYESK